MTPRSPVPLEMGDLNSDSTCVVAQLLYMFHERERPLTLRDIDRSMARAKDAVCSDDRVYHELLRHGLNLTFISTVDVRLGSSTTRNVRGEWNSVLLKKLDVSAVGNAFKQVEGCAAVIIPLKYGSADRTQYFVVAYGADRKEIKLYNPFDKGNTLQAVSHNALQRRMTQQGPLVAVSQ